MWMCSREDCLIRQFRRKQISTIHRLHRSFGLADSAKCGPPKSLFSWQSTLHCIGRQLTKHSQFRDPPVRPSFGSLLLFLRIGSVVQKNTCSLIRQHFYWFRLGWSLSNGFFQHVPSENVCCSVSCAEFMCKRIWLAFQVIHHRLSVSNWLFDHFMPVSSRMLGIVEIAYASCPNKTDPWQIIVSRRFRSLDTRSCFPKVCRNLSVLDVVSVRHWIWRATGCWLKWPTPTRMISPQVAY